MADWERWGVGGGWDGWRGRGEGRWGVMGSVKRRSRALCAAMGGRRGWIDCACVEQQGVILGSLFEVGFCLGFDGGWNIGVWMDG
jgi:hypothetical protein